MITELPISSDAAQTFTVQLADAKYDFALKYNDRSGVWTLDLAHTDGDVLLQSVPVLLGTDLLEPFNLGMGSLLAVDSSNTGLDASPTDFGTRVKLYWFSPDEVPA